MKISCTVCLSRDKRIPATQVATSETGLQWFECNSHLPNDNVAEEKRVKLEPIEQWLKKAVSDGH